MNGFYHQNGPQTNINLPPIRAIFDENLLSRGPSPDYIQTTSLAYRCSSPGSEAASPATESGSSGTYTPTSSVHGFASKVPTTAAHSSRKRSASTPPETDSENDGAMTKKAGKERKTREKHACYIHNLEDLMQIFAGISDGQQQSPGNSNVAGLDMTKDFIFEASGSLLAYFLQHHYETALKHNRVQQWQQEMSDVVHAGQRADNPLAGTWLWTSRPTSEGGNEDKECARKGGKGADNKGCQVHGTRRSSNWRDCRKERRRQNFLRNRERFVEHTQVLARAGRN